MARIPDPWRNPEIWETLVLLGPQGRVTIPNVTVNVRGGGLEEDHAPNPGNDGGERTILGYRDAEVEVEAVADTQAELDNLRAVLELYRNRRGQPPSVLQAAHPNLQLHGVRHVYLFEVESPDFSRDTGFVLRFKLREWQASERRNTEKTSKVGDPPPGGAGTAAPGGNQTSAQKADQNRPSVAGLGRVEQGITDGSAAANRLLGR